MGDSGLLLDFISQAGITYDDDLVKTIIECRWAWDQGEWSAEKEVAFVNVFSQLSRQIAPVTIDTLRAQIPAKKTESKLWSKSRKQKSRAEQAVNHYQRLTAAVLLVLLTFQIYWIIGARAVHHIEKISIRSIQIGQVLDDIPDTASNEQANLLGELSLLEAKYQNDLNLLVQWNSAWAWIPFLYPNDVRADDNKLDSLGFNDVWEQRSHRILQILQEFLLPLLHGLIGALTFILPKLTGEVRAKTFSPIDSAHYRARWIMGMLSGLIIGMFLTSEHSGPLKNLSPMALSFLAGYSIDILFSTLDRFVFAFTSSQISK